MSFEADTLIDRMKLKSGLSRWRLVAIIALALLAIVALGRMADVSLAGSVIARIAIEDIILEDNDRLKILDDIAEDPAIKAVVLHVNSPGGTIVGGESLYEALRNVADKKPLVAVLGGLAASGGYMVAIAADHIVARQGTVTGSIGVMLQTAEITKLSEKIGVNFLTFKSSELKGVPSPFEALSPEAAVVVNETIKDGHQMFMDMVEERRPLSKAQVRAVSDGRIYTGRQALKQKLVDAIGGESQALEWLQKEKKISESLPIRDYPLEKPKRPFDQLYAKIFGGKDLLGVLGSQGLLTLWKPSIF